MYELFLQIVQLVNTFGYFGIFVMTFIESTFIPIPAEFTMIPAGYLVQQGHLNGYLVWIVSVLGTLGGSLTNYFIAYHFGRRFLISYGRYFFINEDKLRAMEYFMQKHGAISTFSGRLLPGVKHFISFPAGLAKMNLKIFAFYTVVGGAMWCAVLIYLGYAIGENEELITQYLKQINFAIVVLIVCLISFYIWKNKIRYGKTVIEKIEEQNESKDKD